MAPVLVDVTPQSLVVETAGGYRDVVVPRNAKIPCEHRRLFTTVQDGQTSVRVRVAQGERPTFPENTFVGELELTGLRPAPRGEVTIAVTFQLDASGTLQVRAADPTTGRETRAVLTLVGIAPDDAVDGMRSRQAGERAGSEAS